jgi:hypothetical protein
VNAKHAWAVIAFWVLTYNGLLAKDGDLLSEQVDEWLKGPPLVRWTTLLTILALAAHLANAISPQRDIISIGFTAVRKLHRKVSV